MVAIDGPAASGKSTTAKLVAQRLRFMHLDTGAMYRAVTLVCLESQLAPQESPQLTQLLADLDIQFKTTGADQCTLVDGRDVTMEIRSAEVTRQVSAFSALPEIRERLLDMQRRIGAAHDVVCEGRDIGTRVFPDARFKFYLVADLEVRAQRRLDELQLAGQQPSLAAIVEELRERDREDSTREHSPLRKAEDAIIIDTTGLTIEEQVDLIAAHVETRLQQGD
ncbi:MAG: (d)CMP kinase [Fidelibacterota bacterium]|nr:MAG: (d)CMP kinase [Candidatus Neomarinimicrobiota bacterium]